MKKAMVRPILRGLSAFALVGAVLGITAGTASAAPTVKLFVKTAGSDSNSCLKAGQSCSTVSHAVSVAENLISATPGTHVLIRVKKGTYAEPPITINQSNITIKRQGGGTVTLAPTSFIDPPGVEDTTTQDVLQYYAPGTTGSVLSGVTLDGSNAFGSATTCSEDWVGIYFPNSSGTLTNVNVKNIQQPIPSAFGCQPGANGDVYVGTCNSSNPLEFGDPCTNYPTPATADVTITGGNYTQYDKNGITCDGAGTTCAITGATVQGIGETGYNAQNGIQIAYGAQATIYGGDVSNNQYTCNGVVDSACYSASGILPYADGGVTVEDGANVQGNDVDIAPVEDTDFTVKDSTIGNTGCSDADVESCQGVETYDATDATVGGAVAADGNTISGNVGGGVYDYASNGTDISNNTISGNGGMATITTCTTAGPPPSGCTTAPPAAVGGGIINEGSTNEDVDPNSIENNSSGGVIIQGPVTGSVVGPSNTISNNAGGGVLLQAAFGATVNDNTISSNAGGGVLGESPPSCGSACQTAPTDSITNNTFSGSTSAGIQLELTGGMTISDNTINTGDSGPGILLVGSDDNTVSTNTVTLSQVGIYVGGNDLTGPSEDNTVSSNQMSNNELGGAAADGYGSPESWNRPGTGNQGIQGEVFFQSSVAVSGAIGNGSPADGVTVVTPSFGPGDYSGVAEFLAAAGAICAENTGIPVDQDAPYGSSLFACTDGAGDIILFGDASSPVTAVTQNQADETTCTTFSDVACTSTDTLTLGALTGTPGSFPTGSQYNIVASGNSFDGNAFANETLAGAIDGSGPNGQLPMQNTTYPDGNPDASDTTIQNTWGNTVTNTGGPPGLPPCNPSTGTPECGV